MKVQQRKQKRAVHRTKGSHPTNEKLLLYLDDKLPEKQLEEVRGHLSDCEDCSDRFLELARSTSRKRKTMKRDFGRRKLAMLRRIDNRFQPLDRPFVLRPRSPMGMGLQIVNSFGFLDPVA